MNCLHRPRRYRFGQRGFTLLEALIAIVILVLAFATTMAIHGQILGSAADNRIRSAAMMLAEEKLEQLRATPFSSAAMTAGTYQEPHAINSFTLFAAAPVSVTRCWTIADETELKRVQVTVARPGNTCTPWGANTLATLSTRIAQNNFARAGTKTAEDTLYNPDGLGELVERKPESKPWDGAPKIEGDFDVLVYKEGENPEYMICDGGKCLVPKPDVNGNQNFGTINGNIFISNRNCDSGEGSLQSRCRVDIVIEGNAICRLSHPNGSEPAPQIAGAAGVAASFSYIRYSCVVADQWRRSIVVQPSSGEKVCVGNPGLVLQSGDPSDQLRSRSRFYDGRAAILDINNVMVDEYPYGIKGGPLEGTLRSVAGSVCMDTDTCFEDSSINGLVPGGHHFLVMPDAGKSCSARMNELALIDAASDTYYSKLFARNPDSFFCTSEKTYNGNFCTWYTRVSGFIENSATDPVAGTDFDIVATGGQLLDACSKFGAFGEGGGGYVCGVRHNAVGSSVNGVRISSAIDFDTPKNYFFINPAPRAFPLDAASRGFFLVDYSGPVIPVDPVDPVEPVDPVDPVDPVTCNITVSGTRGHQNRQVSYRYNGGSWVNCVATGSNQLPTYQCSRDGVTQGRLMQIKSTRTGNHPELGDEFIVNCSNPNVTINF
jgi:prepilin-type N-terminal cleavage/methylation domain-containing protein